MQKNQNYIKTQQLAVIDGETLSDMRLPPAQFCVQSLLQPGVTILGGAPKVGKSWLVLDLCVRIARGEPFFGMPTRQGTVLYLCLEDTTRRIQQRLLSLTDEASANLFFSVEAKPLAEGFCQQIRDFVSSHPDTVLVAVDTFQVIRRTIPDASYANDYQDVRELKALADDLCISVLLVHHLRKQAASDPLDKLSGTTGLSGAVDAAWVLEKSARCQSGAKLTCTGRDIEYRELELRFNNENCAWEVISDSAEEPTLLLPPEMADLLEFMEKERQFCGSNSVFTGKYNASCGRALSPKKLKQLMNKWRYELEARGLYFASTRNSSQRMLTVSFSPVSRDSSAHGDPSVTSDSSASIDSAKPENSFAVNESGNSSGSSDASDEKNPLPHSCVTCVTCVTAPPAENEKQAIPDREPPIP